MSVLFLETSIFGISFLFWVSLLYSMLNAGQKGFACDDRCHVPQGPRGESLLNSVGILACLGAAQSFFVETQIEFAPFIHFSPALSPSFGGKQGQVCRIFCGCFFFFLRGQD